MSGCCGPSPVITSLPPVPRVDVEGSLLCDVLADGTVVGQALVEAVYDTSSGDRVGTRTVDPATGAVYTPQGTLQPCPPPDSCTCETLLLCDVTEVTTPGETPERITNGTFAADASGWTLTGGARQVPSASPDGSVGFLDLSADNNPAGSAEQTVTVTPGLTYQFSASIGMWATGGTTPQSVLVEVVDGSGAVLHSQTVALPVVQGGPAWPAAGVIGPVALVATDAEMTVRFVDQVGGDFIDSLVDDVSLLGPGVPGESTTEAVPFLRTICRTCTGTATVTDTALDGTTVYAVQGVVGVCGPSDSPEVFQHQEILCDVIDGATDTVNVPFGGAGGTLANGVTWTHSGTPDGVQIGPGGGYRIGTPSGSNTVSFDQPVEVVFDVDEFTAGTAQLPAGATLVSLRGAATYDPATRELTVFSAGDGGTFRLASTTGFALSNTGGTLLWRNFAVTAAPAVTRFIRKYIEDAAGAVTSTVDINLDGETYDVQGAVTDCAAADTDEGCAQVIGTLCYQEPTTQDPSFTLHKFNDADPAHPGCLVGLDASDGDFPFIQYNDPITSWEGTYSSNTGTASNLEVSAPELGGFIDWSQFNPPIPSVPNAGIPAPYTGTAIFGGVTVTLEIFTEQALTTGTQYLRLGGSLHFKLSFSSPVTMRFAPQGFADPAAGNDERFCGVVATGVVTGAGEIRTAYGLRDCKTGETTWLDQVSGDTVDLTQTVVVPCAVQQDCASPTEPTATVGLCLADGTPIAVTVVRDCAGTVASEGWLNLTTGAYSAGPPPAGTVACGDSRSIQVSGTFCDVLPDGTVAGLVLIEYSYDDTGAIEAVRLVDAVTGATYTPTGTVTTCPVGVEQPEQDAVILCHTAADGTVTEFLRDYRRDELGAIVGHSDYLLDGTAYTPDPAGTVGVCPPQGCQDCETLILCAEDPATITGQGVSSGTLPNGVAWQARASLTAIGSSVSNADGAWWGNPASFPNVQVTPYTFTFSEPSVVEFSVYMGYFSSAPEPDDHCMQLPAGLEVVSLPTGWNYNAVTGLACVNVTQPADPTGANLANPTKAVSARFRTPGPVSTLTTLFLGPRRAVNGAFRTAWVGALQVTPDVQFLRRICRDCEGMVTAITDTLLDGTTAYVPPATVKVCQPTQDQPQGADAEPLLLCHTAPDGTVTPFLRHIVYNASTGAVSRVTDTLLNGSTLFNGGVGTVGQCNDDCCQPVQVCIQQDPVQSAEFISNEEHRNDNTVDPVWKWTTDLNAANPPWYDMYQYQYSGAWSVTDSDTERPAWWVSPHPFGTSAQSSPARPNEGPSLLNTHWFPRAYFDLPDNADPATIKVQATVFNADQVGRAFRLNDGAWQALPATATHNGVTYTFGPDTIPGATAGRNYLYLDVEETVGGGAGLMVHLKVFYEVIPQTRSWTRMVCCDGSVYYIDEDGQRQDSVPDGWHVAPCSGSTAEGAGVETVLLCDVTEVTTPGETPERITNGHFAANLDGWTIIGGAAYVPTGGPDGQVGVLDFSQNNQSAGRAEQTTTVTPGLTYNLSARIGIWSTGGTTPQRVLVEVLDGSGAVLHSQTVAPAAVSGGPLWPADGVVGPVPIVATDTEMTVRFTDQVGGDFIDALLDDVSLLGPGVPGTSEGQAVPFLRHYTVAPDTEGVSYFDTTLDGATYAPQGEVTACAGATPGSDDGTPAVVSTGARSLTGTAPVDLAAQFPGLQSVTLLVSAGSVLATLTNGAAVPIPAGANVTWSVTRDQDTALDAASFAGADAGTTYLLLFTYTA
jgi:hypothetical protein